jgi:hypothetical protein
VLYFIEAAASLNALIAPAHVGRIFDRFYRVDSGQTNSWLSPIRWVPMPASGGPAGHRFIRLVDLLNEILIDFVRQRLPVYLALFRLLVDEVYNDRAFRCSPPGSDSTRISDDVAPRHPTPWCFNDVSSVLEDGPSDV